METWSSGCGGSTGAQTGTLALPPALTTKARLPLGASTETPHPYRAGLSEPFPSSTRESISPPLWARVHSSHRQHLEHRGHHGAINTVFAETHWGSQRVPAAIASLGWDVIVTSIAAPGTCYRPACVVCCAQSLSLVQVFVTLWAGAHQAPLSRDTGLGCHFLLWVIFPTQESNLCLLHLLYWQVDSWPPHPCRPDRALMQHRGHRILPDLTTSSLFPDTGLANGSFRFSRYDRKLNKLFGQLNIKYHSRLK